VRDETVSQDGESDVTEVMSDGLEAVSSDWHQGQ